MFSRRHPLLFSFLIFSGLASVTLVAVAVIIAAGPGISEYEIMGGAEDGEQVGVVEVLGVIADAKETIRQLRRFREDENIRAIVLRVDSPGGVVGPSQEIYREVAKTRQVKKVVASMGAVAASGGYYVVASADGIIANPGTITGSIGVIMEYTNFKELFSKIGLAPVVIKSGTFKDTGSPVRDITPEEEKYLQAFVQELHEQFVAAIAAGRKMKLDTVRKLADGRIYTGADAKSLGLVDRIGNLEDAVQWAGELAGVKGEVTAVYIPARKTSLLQLLSEATLRDLLGRVARPEWTAGYIYAPSHN
ncbi:MAG: signal peptide peptidase SppA [Desulfobacterales bacterium]|nr:signal peptide peptidase SppA [Desulfobacterales bacterium]MDJ0853743.1 signal peptide peptidase SppA [Desulfobacterales bacterium]MDJ0988593.1 signal peptide peptidase SppA [Desulfobacterales bacterium]